MILTRSIRRVTPKQAREIFSAAPALKRVGVMGRENIQDILGAAADADLDILQLHASYTLDEHAQIRQGFDGEIWAVLPIDGGTGKPQGNWKEIIDLADAIVLDTLHDGRSGGTGQTFNWQAAASAVEEVKRHVPVVLAGGLTSQNVTRAIEMLRPTVVDVSSGVESSPAIKSPKMMSAFAQAVLSASIV